MRLSTTPPHCDGPACPVTLTAYMHASTRALHACPIREAAIYVEAMEALHLMSTLAPTRVQRGAAAHALALAKQRTRAAYAHPAHAAGRDLVPGRAVWVERADACGRLATVAATIVAIDGAGTRALLALEADPRVRWWTLTAALAARTAEPVPIRTASRPPALVPA